LQFGLGLRLVTNGFEIGHVRWVGRRLAFGVLTAKSHMIHHFYSMACMILIPMTYTLGSDAGNELST
jgi:hypothetical protein